MNQAEIDRLDYFYRQPVPSLTDEELDEYEQLLKKLLVELEERK